MFELSVTTHFSAAHRLAGYPGQCARLHGHNWEVQVYLQGPSLNDLGMLLDFREIKAALKDALAELDHADLNELPAFMAHNPTSENIARYLYEVLARRFDAASCRIARVSVAETPGTAAFYWNDGHR
jgi:6-pyruvoyltetrahydropterin/6-carboxytetrahydropterin synthase